MQPRILDRREMGASVSTTDYATVSHRTDETGPKENRFYGIKTT